MDGCGVDRVVQFIIDGDVWFIDVQIREIRLSNALTASLTAHLILV